MRSVHVCQWRVWCLSPGTTQQAARHGFSLVLISTPRLKRATSRYQRKNIENRGEWNDLGQGYIRVMPAGSQVVQVTAPLQSRWLPRNFFQSIQDINTAAWATAWHALPLITMSCGHQVLWAFLTGPATASAFSHSVASRLSSITVASSSKTTLDLPSLVHGCTESHRRNKLVQL